MKFFIMVFLLVAVAQVFVSAADEKDCEVCISVLDKFATKAKADNIQGLDKLENMFRKECKEFTHSKEKRLCWYLGASADSATNIIREVSRPISIGVPADTICKRLKKKDAAICALRMEGSSVIEPVDNKPKVKKPKTSNIPWAKLKALKVKDLKKHLQGFGVTCTTCVEKEDYVKELLKFKPKQEL